MGTIYPPFQSLAPRVAAQWTPLGGVVRVDGWAANFAGIVGGETVRINPDGAGAANVVMAPGDVTALLVAARINATFAGIASVNPNGGIRLTGAASMVVDNITQPDFAKIGLPWTSRLIAATTTFRPEAAVCPDRLDIVSDPITVPDGANRIAVWVRISGNDNTNVGCPISAAFSNGTEGLPSGTIFNAGIVREIVPYKSETTAEYYAGKQQFVYVPAEDGVSFTSVYEFEVPPGATSFYLIPGSAQDPVSGTRAYKVPSLQAGVICGVR